MTKNKMNLQKKHAQKIKQFVTAARKAAAYNLVKCSSGNLSYRLDDKLAALSASKTWLAELTVEQVAICELDTGKCINGKTPTIESSFHLGILRNRPDVNVVLHFQTPFATAIACGKKRNYNFNIIVEVPAYIGTPVFVDYRMPGSTQLAKAVVEKAKKHDMIILRNHGLVTVGSDFDDAIQKAVFFELACRILLSQPNPELLSKASIEQIRKAKKA